MSDITEKIIASLTESPKTVRELSSIIGVSRGTIAYRIKSLHAANVIYQKNIAAPMVSGGQPVYWNVVKHKKER